MKKTKFSRISCFMISIIVLGVFFMSTPTPVYAQGGGVTENEDHPGDSSFANMASAASGAFMDIYFEAGSTAPAHPFDTVFGGINYENAGGLLGFHNDARHRSKSGILQQKSSNSSAALSYAAYMKGDLMTACGSGAPNNVFTPYLTFGSAMADIGLDTYASGVNTATMNRIMSGGLVYIVYGFTTLIEQIFGMVIDFLIMINPFRLLFPSKAGDIWRNWGSYGGVNVQTPPGPLTNIANVMSDIYNYLQAGSWIIITLIIGFFFGMFFLFHKRMSDWSRWKKMLLRISFIAFGIPLLGGSYTVMLDKLKGTISGSGGVSPGTSVIASTFVDFEGRVMQSWEGLDVGTNIPVRFKITGSDGTVTVYTQSTSAMRLCAQWNSGIAGAPTSLIYPPTDTEVNSLINAVYTSTSGTGSDTNVEWAKRVLKDYMTGKTIDAEEYAGNYIAKAWSIGSPSAGSFTWDQKNSQLTFMTSPAGIEDAHGDVQMGGGLFDFPSGGSITGDLKGNPFHNIHSGMSAITAGGPATFTHASMSPMATYNYLNTQFGPTSATVFSSTESASGAIKKYHYSVNLANDSVDGFCMVFMIVAMLGCISVMGIVYALGILFTNIKRGVRLLVAIPGAMIGSLHAISRIISYVCIMLIEVAMTIMLYALFSDLLITIPLVFADSIMGPFASHIGQFAFILYILIGAIFIWFTIMAIKYRTVILKAVETAGDNVVQQFVGINDGAGAAMATGMAGAGGSSSGQTASAKKGGLIGDGAAAALGFAGGGVPGAMIGSKANRKLASLGDTSKEERKLSDIVGGSGSAMGDERARDERIKGKIEARKKEATDKLMGGAQAAIGAAELAGGAASGNPMLMANGAKSMASGGKKLQKAGEEREATEERLDSLSEADLGGGSDGGTVNAPANHGKSGISPVSSALGNAAGDAAGDAAGSAANSVGSAVGDAVLPGSGTFVGGMAENVAKKEVSEKVSEGVTGAVDGASGGGKGMAPKNADGGSAINGGGGTVIHATETGTQAKVIASGGGGQPTATAAPSMTGGGTVRPVASSSPVMEAAANAPAQGPQSAATQAPQSAAGGAGNFVPTGGSYSGGSGSSPVAAAAVNEGGGGFDAGGGNYSAGNGGDSSIEGKNKTVNVNDKITYRHNVTEEHVEGSRTSSGGFNLDVGNVSGQNASTTVQDRMQINHQRSVTETYTGNAQGNNANPFADMGQPQNTSEFRSATHEVIRSHRANIRDIYGGTSGGGGAKPPVPPAPDADADAS